MLRAVPVICWPRFSQLSSPCSTARRHLWRSACKRNYQWCDAFCVAGVPQSLALWRPFIQCLKQEQRNRTGEHCWLGRCTFAGSWQGIRARFSSAGCMLLLCGTRDLQMAAISNWVCVACLRFHSGLVAEAEGKTAECCKTFADGTWHAQHTWVEQAIESNR